MSSPPIAVTMQVILQKCPAFYCATSDGTMLLAQLSADMNHFTVSAVTATNENFQKDFDEVHLTPIKEEWVKGCSWEKFFGDMQGLFNRGFVKFENDAVILQQDTIPSRIFLKLASTKESIQEFILTNLINYLHVQQNIREVEKEVQERTSQLTTLRARATALDKEEKMLRESIVKNKEQNIINEGRYKKLQEEYKIASEAKRGEENQEDVSLEDEDSVLCHVRLPLGRKECKTYDVSIMKLVKSKFVNEKGGDSADAPYNKITRPFTSSELEMYTKKLNNVQKKTIWEALQKIDDWDFNVFSMQSAMAGDDTESLSFQPNGGSLLVTGYALFFKYGFMQEFRIDEKILLNWLSCIEAGYCGNPYHNSMHAADVLQITHFILSKGGMIRQCKLTSNDIFAALAAATIHDFSHPGINNMFHIKSSTYLAYLYNDRSILENYHVSSVFEIMKLPCFNLLQSLPMEQMQDIHDTMVEMVLATDMGMHGKFVTQFKKRIQENHELTKKEDQRLAMSMAIKMADVSNCGRPTPLYLKWANKIADEFYMQGDRERNLNMVCSPFMDRLQPAMGKGQISFMNYVIIPLFDCISDLVPGMRFATDFCEQNKLYWTSNDDT